MAKGPAPTAGQAHRLHLRGPGRCGRRWRVRPGGGGPHGGRDANWPATLRPAFEPCRLEPK
eukprot:7308478-Prorocentrum_lima.AAC.1